MPYLTPPVSILLDKPRTLYFDTATFHAADRKFKQHWGDHKRLMAITRTLVAAIPTNEGDPSPTVDELDISLTDWSILCWAGLQHESPMSYEAFCSVVSMGQIMSGIAAIIAAFVQGMFLTGPETAPATSTAEGTTGPLVMSGIGPDTGREPASSSS